MRLLILLLLTYSMVFSPNAVGKNKITVAVGLQKPPYVIEKQHSGFEIELIRAVLNEMNYQAEFVYIPFGRSWRMLGVSGIDAVMTTTDKVVHDKAKLSDVYIYYQNVAITLKNTLPHYKISSISELKNYSVAAFQNANKVLGDDFSQAVESMPYYVEIADQQRQLKLLLQKKVDVIIIDENIFNYFIQEMRFQTVGTFNYKSSDFIIHPVFPRSAYRMAFNDATKTAQFNQALTKVLNSRYYQELIDKYKLFL